MKKIILHLAALLFTTQLLAQKAELSIQAGPAFYHQTGSGAVSESFILQGSSNDLNYTNNPNGNKFGTGYHALVQLKLAGKCGVIWGLQAGFERVASKVSINQVYPYYGLNAIAFINYAAAPYPAVGQTYLRSNFINVAPFVGYRIKLKNASIDMAPGFELAFGLKSKEDGRAVATNNATVYTTTRDRGQSKSDVRLKFDAEFNYKRYGITAGYAHGILNNQRNTLGDGYSPDSKSELLRFGLSYRIF